MINAIKSLLQPTLRKLVTIPFVTVDSLVMRSIPFTPYHEILLVQRKRNPYKGKLAFPGGFIEYNESPSAACLRELHEETGIKGTNPLLIDVVGNAGRDPRHHVISIVYKVNANISDVPIGKDDAELAAYFNIVDILDKKHSLAFDHLEILVKYLSENHNEYKELLNKKSHTTN